jgi:hypothetical protein
MCNFPYNYNVINKNMKCVIIYLFLYFQNKKFIGLISIIKVFTT